MAIKTKFNDLAINAAITILVVLGLIPLQASATVITYEHLPTSIDRTLVSHHITGGPILADDFTPAISGDLFKVDWWGSQATSDQWELVFHTDNNGQPNVDSPISGGFIKHNPVTATGIDIGGGIFYYTALWNPQDLTLAAGTDYWFTVANHDDGWNWALATGIPSVGSEQYDAARSTGSSCMDGGPHCGPWTNIADTDLAFRLHVVPAPATFALMGLGLVGLSIVGRRKALTAE